MAVHTRHLTTDELKVVRASVGDPAMPRRLLQRYYIVWLSSDGCGVPAIAQAVGVCEATVRLWLRRFARHGLNGCTDLPRPGAALRIDAARVVALCENAVGGPRVTALLGAPWTLDRLVQMLHEQHGVEVGRSRLQQILQDAGVEWRLPPCQAEQPRAAAALHAPARHELAPSTRRSRRMACAQHPQRIVRHLSDVPGAAHL